MCRERIQRLQADNAALRASFEEVRVDQDVKLQRVEELQEELEMTKKDLSVSLQRTQNSENTEGSNWTMRMRKTPQAFRMRQAS